MKRENKAIYRGASPLTGMRFLGMVLLLSLAGRAQQHVYYLGFLDADTSIRWAGEYQRVVCLMPRSLGQSLDRYYLDALRQRRLETWEADPNGFRVWQQPSANDSLLAARRQPAWVNTRYLHNVTRRERGIGFDSTKAAPLFTSQRRPNDDEVFSIRQILYFREGRFYVDNVLVTPLSFEPTDSGLRWYRYFASSFALPEGKLPDTTRCIYLGTTVINYPVSSSDTALRLLTRHQPNPIWCVLADAEAKGALLPNRSNRHTDSAWIRPGSFFVFLQGPIDTTPVRKGANGPITAYKVSRSFLPPAALSTYGIEQSFYFNPKTNRLFSVVHRVVINRDCYREGKLVGITPVTELRYSFPPVSPERAFEEASD